MIDYAKEIAGWSYTDLCNAVRARRAWCRCRPVATRVRGDEDDFDSARFIDAVSRNLEQRGNFLLMIVGDGNPGRAWNTLSRLPPCRTPQLGFTLGLVEIALFRLGDDGTLMVQPTESSPAPGR